MLRFFSLLIGTAAVSGCGPAPAPPLPANVPHYIARDIALAPDTTLVSARVAAGATLASILRTHEVVASDAAALVARAAALVDLRKVRAHQSYVRLMRNGVFVNPITAHWSVPPAVPVPESDMVAFVATRDRAMAALSTSAVAHVSDRNATVQ